MLLRNESKVKHSIQVKLVYDDNSTCELELCEQDTVHMSYRKNGCLYFGTGVIREIRPYVHTKKWVLCKKRESAIITLDMSKNMVSCIDKIDMFDIVKVTKIEKCEGKSCCKCNSDITEDNNIQEEVIDEGVISND